MDPPSGFPETHAHSKQQSKAKDRTANHLSKDTPSNSKFVEWSWSMCTLKCRGEHSIALNYKSRGISMMDHAHDQRKGTTQNNNIPDKIIFEMAPEKYLNVKIQISRRDPKGATKRTTIQYPPGISIQNFRNIYKPIQQDKTSKPNMDQNVTTSIAVQN